MPRVERKLGGIFRDHRETVIRAYCFDVGVGMAFFVEILVVIQGIKYAYSAIGVGSELSWIP